MEMSLQQVIQSEREKLDNLISDSLANQIPLSQNDGVQRQAKVLEKLIEKANASELSQ